VTALLFMAVVRSVAALPEPQRRDYIRANLLAPLDPSTEQTVLAALPADSAAACRQLIHSLREWR
jgi:hypothetical protein